MGTTAAFFPASRRPRATSRLQRTPHPAEYLLRSVPLVPPSTWQYALPTGRTTAAVRFEFREKEEVRSIVTLRPDGRADLSVPEIDATLTQVNATTRIVGQKIEIVDGKANLAGGTAGSAAGST